MTSAHNNSFRRSINLLNANLVFVIAASFLEINMTNWGVLFILAQAVVKIVFYSGMYGMFVELASGESIVTGINKLKSNAKDYWKLYTLIVLLHFVIFLIFFLYLPYIPALMKLIHLFLTIFISALIVIVFVSKKYLKPLGLAKRKVMVKARDAVILLLLYLILIAYSILPLITDIHVSRFVIISLFFRAYISSLFFLYLAHLVINNYPEIRQSFAFKNELYLINPIEGGGVFFHWVMYFMLRGQPPPAWITILKALTPERYHIRVFNRAIWHPCYFASGKLVGISCSTTNNSPEAYKLAKEFKKRGSTVIMGGLHVQAFPQEALEYCDSVVLGEAEGIWSQVIEDYENHCLQKEYYPREDESAYQRIHQYQRNLSSNVIQSCIETTRGCKYNCYFCALRNMKLSHHRKPVSEVIDLVKRLGKKNKTFTFLDNNLYSDPEYLRELFQALKPLKIKWLAASTLEIAEDDTLLSLAKESGCCLLYLGYEIAPGMKEQKQGGKLSMAQQYLELSHKIQKKGILIRAHYILGFDFQGLKSFWDLFIFNLRLRPLLLALFILTPLPGSPFFNHILPQNRIKTLNWRNYNVGNLVFKSEKIPAFFLRQPFYSFYLLFMFIFTTKFGWIVGVLLVLNCVLIIVNVFP